MLDKKFRLFEDVIQTQVEDRLVGFKSQLQKVEDKVKEMDLNKNNQPKKESWNKITT
jgi:hypothetical protein